MKKGIKIAATAALIVLAPLVTFAREVLFAGDVTLTRNIKPTQKEFFTEKAKDRINRADLFVWNLEFSGASSNKKNKQFVFSCDSDIVKGMKFANGVANVANNHSFDGNVEGFRNLIASLNEHEMAYCGLKNADPNKNYTEITRDDNRYFIIGYSPMSRGADPVYTTSNWKDVLASVNYLNAIKRPGKDFVIVNIHDGVEGATNVAPRQIAQAETLADLGVDTVCFTHSHTYIEPSRIKDTVVLWGMGNFIFGGNNAWRDNRDVRMVSVNMADKSWRWIKGKNSAYVFDTDDETPIPDLTPAYDAPDDATER